MRLRLVAPLLGLLMIPAWAGRAAPAPYAWPAAPQFLPVTAGRVAALPVSERPAWDSYLARSAAQAAKLPAPRAAFVTPDLRRLEGPGIPSKHSKGLTLRPAGDWYAGTEAAAIADRVVAAQSRTGGWTKGNDYTGAPTVAEGTPDVWSGGTFDNDATTWETRFLALTAAQSKYEAKVAVWRSAVVRAIEYTLAAQYPNGGFPQIYPLAGGYHDAITFNDDAMIQAVELLRDVAEPRPEFAFVPAEIRTACGPAVERAIRCILATQLTDATGARTVWCQQHDALTLRPCAARNFEPVAACTNESAALLRFLLGLPRPSPEVAAAIRGAAGWLQRVALRDLAWTRQNGAGQLLARPGAGPLWARMYELGTDRPIFGDRDRTVHFDVTELSSERRAGYAWFGTWPAGVLEDFKAWAAAHP